jgi:pilus assembly protein CpaB
MQSRTVRNLAIAMIAVALCLGLFALRLVRDLRQTATPAVPDARAELARVVVAVAAIEEGKPVAKESLSLEAVSLVPDGSFTKIEDVIGRKVYQRVGQGEPLLARHFRPPGPVASRIKPGERAIAVKVDGVIGLGGFIQPDDRVDVLLYLQRDQREIPDTQARVLLENIRVLAYGANLERREQDDKEDNTTNARTAVIAVPEADVDRLMLGASKGLLRLALRGDPVDGDPSAPVARASGTQYESLSSLLGGSTPRPHAEGVASTIGPTRATRVHRGDFRGIDRY